MIELINVNKNIKGKEVLSDINYKFKEGKIYLVTGHNGSGKTMLLRLLCGLLTPNSGEVKVSNNISYGVIIEKPSFIDRESALYNLKYLADINKKIGIEEITETLKDVNLFDKRKDKVKTFSLGMKQRLAIAQALMEDPQVLLLDEPFNALDDENYIRVLDLLKREKEKNKLIVIAAHGIIDNKEELIDEEIRLSNGKIVETLEL
ncbi:MAG TPA: ABC transporter ATP-binding protein [Clostridiales bacterium]|nr:ABC transporter ATP-binding protein [Clostridiales bacterium]